MMTIATSLQNESKARRLLTATPRSRAIEQGGVPQTPRPDSVVRTETCKVVPGRISNIGIRAFPKELPSVTPERVRFVRQEPEKSARGWTWCCGPTPEAEDPDKDMTAAGESLVSNYLLNTAN